MLLKIRFPGCRDMYRSIFSKHTIYDFIYFYDYKLPVYDRRVREQQLCIHTNVFIDRQCRRGRLFDLFQ